MTASSRRCLTRDLLGIFVLLLLTLLQMVTSLVYYAGVFVLSEEVLISPFFFRHAHGDLSCDGWHGSSPNGADSGIKINAFKTLVILCLYVPLVLVAFALLAVLLAAYAKDRTLLGLSVDCQGTSSFLTLAGIIVFLLLYQSCLSWEGMTLWFYVCAGVQVELAIITVLTSMLWKRLPCDWE